MNQLYEQRYVWRVSMLLSVSLTLLMIAGTQIIILNPSDPMSALLWVVPALGSLAGLLFLRCDGGASPEKGLTPSTCSVGTSTASQEEEHHE